MIAALRTFETGQFFSASPAMRANPASSRLAPSQGKSRLADLESRAVRIQRDRSFSGEFRRVEPGSLQTERQCHCEAAGMRSSNQFFRICTFLAFKASLNK